MTAILHARSAAEPDDSGNARHQIGAAAAHVGVSTSVLRLWERQGLVRPSRSASGYRLYSDADLRRLRRIRRMRDDQVSAGGIRRLLRPAAPPRRGRAQRDAALDGARIRAWRRERGLSLRDAADQAGLSPSFLSALERNVSGASVATLQRLTHAFGITLLDLFPRRSRIGRRVRASERQALTLGSGVRIEQLTRSATLLEPQLFVLGPGAASEGAYAHEGEEFIYVLDGRLTIWVDEGERYQLSAGDALTFPSTLPHRWRNRAGGETRLLWINTPPTF
jgi:DNA-binding transcriptional MerR regulator/mannose-6-phosphate isomerase-like protein (cupin superfamily)